MEGRQSELTSELEKPQTYQEPGRAQAINRELTGVIDGLKNLTAEWETEAAKLEGL